jgi:hypothetical protein
MYHKYFLNISCLRKYSASCPEEVNSVSALWWSRFWNAWSRTLVHVTACVITFKRRCLNKSGSCTYLFYLLWNLVSNSKHISWRNVALVYVISFIRKLGIKFKTHPLKKCGSCIYLFYLLENLVFYSKHISWRSVALVCIYFIHWKTWYCIQNTSLDKCDSCIYLFYLLEN